MVGLGTNQSESPAGAISLMSMFSSSPKERIVELAQQEMQRGEAYVRKQEALRAYKKAVMVYKGKSQAQSNGTDEGGAIVSAIRVLELLKNEADGLVYQITKNGEECGKYSLDYFTERVFEIIKGKRDVGFTNFNRALEYLKQVKDDHFFVDSELKQMEKEEQDRLRGQKLEDTLVFDDTMDEDYEIYFDQETGDQYKVPVELVRDFSRAELIGNKNDEE